ncbi:uncharacterized protein LOC133035923 [Cannabis sativa]|uniref:uncharacterized protein LOC133035923 n=1 Tax=Cannabis sativa TaxID=3483 RepID=UPI0029C9E634|nr:uncharacterized protein LOC133035923 [Cannabis sativa]
MPVGMNNTNNVLIPKKKNPEQMSELRPISLCNVIAKVITKVLANRMKGLLSEVISKHQSAFIPGRLITDNIMVSFEILHYLQRKQVGKDGFMALKLDLSKAYDRVDWHFLCAMLARLGFADKWIRLIFGCLSSVQYQIVSSGRTMGPIVPSRGLRYGDPISPYLFLVCVEAFPALTRKFEERKWLHGCKVANGAPSVSHMLFADDSFLYCKATNGEMNRVLQLLRMFAIATGQRVNFGKSSSFFRTNTSVDLRRAICDIERAITKFWWRSNKNKGIHWLSWDQLTKPKSNGGMGFCDLRDLNLALLDKQGWRLLTCGDSSMGQIYKARYFSSGSFLTSTLGSNPSYIWQSVFEAKELVRAGVRRSCGEVLAEMLTARDRALVWKIPLSSHMSTDLRYWLHDASGVFTVRSAYSLLQSMKTSRDIPDNSGIWRLLWQLQLPPKVLNFLWRASTNSLPTRLNLSTKHVPIAVMCSFCLATPETTMHVLAQCSFAKSFWSKVPICSGA